MKRLLGELPAWAQREHPLLRYELQRQLPPAQRARRLAVAAGQIVLVLILLAGGYLYASQWLTQPAGINPTQGLWRVLYFPVLGLQLLLSLIVLSISAQAIQDERRRQTWDNLRATESGAGIKLRTRWVAVFYRVRGLLGMILLARLLLAFALLYELTSHRGGYLDMLTATIMPEVPLPLGMAIMAAQLTAACLLPIAQTGLEIALGLLVGVAVRNPAYSGISQMGLLLVKLCVVIGLLLAATRFLAGTLPLPDGLAWLLLASFSAFGDHGLLLLQAGQAGDIWARVPYTVFLGPLLLLMVLLIAALTDAALAYAVHRAERTE